MEQKTEVNIRAEQSLVDGPRIVVQSNSEVMKGALIPGEVIIEVIGGRKIDVEVWSNICSEDETARSRSLEVGNEMIVSGFKGAVDIEA
jgi:hypothetical protein